MCSLAEVDRQLICFHSSSAASAAFFFSKNYIERGISWFRAITTIELSISPLCQPSLDISPLLV